MKFKLQTACSNVIYSVHNTTVNAVLNSTIKQKHTSVYWSTQNFQVDYREGTDHSAFVLPL